MLTTLSSKPPKRRISKMWDTNIHTTIKTRMPAKILAELDSFISR